MEIENQKIVALILKHLRQELTEEEKAELQYWIAASDRNALLFRRCTDDLFLEEGLESLDQLGDEDVWENEKVWTAIKGRKPIKMKAWYAAAASILIIISVTVYQFTRPVAAPPQMAQTPVILPGTNKAVLQLADGTIIPLDSTANGTLAQQGNINIIKLDSGKLAYQADAATDESNLYNTIITPRGGQYQVTLADGSKVWLNAASSLRFPATFKGRPNRVVELIGEAYFEVAKDKQQPFRVTTKNVEIEVLGTHFNVMAYKDEDMLKTTLLEGSVKVSSDAASALLQPGQQAQVTTGKPGIAIVKDADVQQATAWKNGIFEFTGEDIHSVMRQLARWYDIDVQIAAPISSHFMGTISRNVNASEVFKMLEMTGAVKFTSKNNQVTVRSK
ncbi:DUF4974 domain-containing protein [Chitinophaga sp. SYP-B3965]|uniref:FecR family protein n=1 Tax=Chitinophaga sp. SYP-B3965 TaxID=2663120 RepID=UPI001299C66E|nr:FecR family protein [Chitinophaga sp. SYP-B3965]MRG44517.1 DUF4974 domain-containing protein [Chitinophaga sp. SYP-B3965]